MSARLDQLSKELQALPELPNQLDNTMLTSLKTQGMLVATMFSLDGAAASGGTVLQSLISTVEKSKARLGEFHPANVILRKMVVIATALVAGKHEPSDAEIDRIVSGKPIAAAAETSPAAKRGCAILIVGLLSAAAVVSVAIGFFHN